MEKDVNIMDYAVRKVNHLLILKDGSPIFTGYSLMQVPKNIYWILIPTSFDTYIIVSALDDKMNPRRKLPKEIEDLYGIQCDEPYAIACESKEFAIRFYGHRKQLALL